MHKGGEPGLKLESCTNQKSLIRKNSFKKPPEYEHPAGSLKGFFPDTASAVSLTHGGKPITDLPLFFYPQTLFLFMGNASFADIVVADYYEIFCQHKIISMHLVY